MVASRPQRQGSSWPEDHIQLSNISHINKEQPHKINKNYPRRLALGIDIIFHYRILNVKKEQSSNENKGDYIKLQVDLSLHD
jgi:hypothetical protein